MSTPTKPKAELVSDKAMGLVGVLMVWVGN